MGVEPAVVDEGSGMAEVEDERPRLTAIIVGSLQHDVDPAVAGSVESVVADHRMVVRIHIDPADGIARVDRLGKRCEAVLFGHDDLVVDDPCRL
jgi:hypothetical protein